MQSSFQIHKAKIINITALINVRITTIQQDESAIVDIFVILIGGQFTVIIVVVGTSHRAIENEKANSQLPGKYELIYVDKT